MEMQEPRARFAEVVREEFDVLRSDPEQWEAYLAEFELALGDGID